MFIAVSKKYQAVQEMSDVKPVRSTPNRRRKPARKSIDVDPEILLSEELDFIPVSLQIEEQVRKLRNLENAFHKASKANEHIRRIKDQNDVPAIHVRDYSYSNKNHYLVPIAVRLKLQAGEQCYLKAPATWGHVCKTLIAREILPDPALPSKHLSIRTRGETPDYPSKLSKRTRANGNFYLTNRRLICTGKSNHRMSINLRSIYCRAVFQNAIEIHHSDFAGSQTRCDVIFLPEYEIQLADSLFQSLGG